MPRRPRPWYRVDKSRPDKNGWYVNFGGRRHLLHRGKRSAADRKIAETKFHELMLLAVKAPEAPDATVASLCEAFLEWSARWQSPETHRGYLWYIQSFAELCGLHQAGELKPFHVNRWIDSKKRWGATSRYNGLRSVFRVFNWACDEGLIDRNPLRGMKRPKPNIRSRYMTDEEYSALLQAACVAYRIFLYALDQTGARPSELRAVQWSHLRTDRLVLTEHKTVGKTHKPRVIYLNASMLNLLDTMKSESKSAYIFTNVYGRPWTRNALRLQMQRLKKKLKLDDDVCLYLIRHRFGTKAAMRGLNSSTIAELMGHNSTEMVDRVYVHLAGESRHLHQALEQATASS